MDTLEKLEKLMASDTSTKGWFILVLHKNMHDFIRPNFLLYLSFKYDDILPKLLSLLQNKELLYSTKSLVFKTSIHYG